MATIQSVTDCGRVPRLPDVNAGWPYNERYDDRSSYRASVVQMVPLGSWYGEPCKSLLLHHRDGRRNTAWVLGEDEAVRAERTCHIRELSCCQVGAAELPLLLAIRPYQHMILLESGHVVTETEPTRSFHTLSEFILILTSQRAIQEIVTCNSRHDNLAAAIPTEFNTVY